MKYLSYSTTHVVDCAGGYEEPLVVDVRHLSDRQDLEGVIRRELPGPRDLEEVEGHD